MKNRYSTHQGDFVATGRSRANSWPLANGIGGACDQDFCGGDNDDVESCCSWTTDQGDFCDPNRHVVSVATLCDFNDGDASVAIPAEAANQSSPASSYRQDGSFPNAMVPAQGMPNAKSGVPMAMWQGCGVPMCYVVMPKVENPLPCPNAYPMQEQWSHNPNQLYEECCSQSWGTQSQASTSYSTPEGRKNNQSHNNSISSRESCGSSQCSDSSDMTTVILRNLPVECTRDIILQLLDDEGFLGTYDFLHVPTNFQTKEPLGYALLNLTAHEVAVSVIEHFEGFSNWPCSSDNFCEVAWNSPHQGFEVHVDRYRNSPLMHSSVPEVYRPVVFANGIRIAFPAPTTRTKAPRIRHQKPSKGQTQPERRDQMPHVFK